MKTTRSPCVFRAEPAYSLMTLAPRAGRGWRAAPGEGLSRPMKTLIRPSGTFSPRGGEKESRDPELVFRPLRPHVVALFGLLRAERFLAGAACAHVAARRVSALGLGWLIAAGVVGSGAIVLVAHASLNRNARAVVEKSRGAGVHCQQGDKVCVNSFGSSWSWRSSSSSVRPRSRSAARHSGSAAAT